MWDFVPLIHFNIFDAEKWRSDYWPSDYSDYWPSDYWPMIIGHLSSKKYGIRRFFSSHSLQHFWSREMRFATCPGVAKASVTSSWSPPRRPTTWLTTSKSSPSTPWNSTRTRTPTKMRGRSGAWRGRRTRKTSSHPWKWGGVVMGQRWRSVSEIYKILLKTIC